MALNHIPMSDTNIPNPFLLQPDPWIDAPIINVDTLIAQQEEERKQIQAQLAASQQDTQRQQLQLETLTEQLEAAQKRVVQLEQECALLKDDAQEKTQQLQTSEKHIRELLARLQRQQRYTLQYKADLEKRSQNPVPAPKAQSQPQQPVPISAKVSAIPSWASQQPFFLADENSLPQTSAKGDSPETTTQLAPKIEATSLTSTPSSLAEDIPEPELLVETESHRQLSVDEVKKSAFPPPLISRDHKSKLAVDLPGFLRNH